MSTKEFRDGLIDRIKRLEDSHDEMWKKLEAQLNPTPIPSRDDRWEASQLESEIRTLPVINGIKSDLLHTLSKLLMFATESHDEWKARAAYIKPSRFKVGDSVFVSDRLDLNYGAAATILAATHIGLGGWKYTLRFAPGVVDRYVSEPPRYDEPALRLSSP